MSLNSLTVFTFTISNTFEEWSTFFDSKDSIQKLKEFNIKPIFRGKNKEDSQKVIVIHQAPDGNLQKFFEKYGSWIATHGINVSSIEVSVWQ